MTVLLSPRRRFLLAGAALAAAIIAALLWLGSLRHALTHFSANIHQTCGQPVSLRAEGYNLLGGTRYGTDAGDPGDDVDLAHLDICDPVVQVMAHGEERLWFWLEVTATGQTFPYYAWGIPEEDIHNPNANEYRDPVDPLWDYRAITVLRYELADGYWQTGRGELCPLDPDDLPPVNLFIDSGNAFRIPVGGTRAAWVCVRMGFGQPLPNALVINFRPLLTRLTRWVDKPFDIAEDTAPTYTPFGEVRRHYLLPVLHTNEEVCAYAQEAHPESIGPGGCPPVPGMGNP
jgi:hypothetical protein